MPTIRRSFLLALLTLCATTVGAQERDAYVLRWGEVRLHAEADFSRAAEQFGSDGRTGLGELDASLTAENFVPVAELEAAADAFLQATSGSASGAFTQQPLSAGDLAAEVRSNARVLPISLSIGVIPRIEIGGTVEVLRNERIATRVDLEGGNLGINPNPSGNAARLSAIDPSGQALGSWPVLPLAGSALGQELQHRVTTLTGAALQLPEEPLAAGELLETYPVDPFPYVLGDWTVGDIKLHGRAQLLSSFGSRAYPDSTGFDYRVAAGGGIRIATARSVERELPLSIGPEYGVGGYFAGATLDLFSGEQFWVTVDGEWESFGERSIRGWLPGEPLGAPSVQIRRAPGDQLDLRAIGRIRMTQELSAGGILHWESFGEGSVLMEGSSTPLDAQSLTSVGLSLRYSTLQALEAGRSNLPLEIAGGVTAAIAGSGSIPARSRAFLQLSILPRLWGGPGSAPTVEP